MTSASLALLHAFVTRQLSMHPQLVALPIGQRITHAYSGLHVDALPISADCCMEQFCARHAWHTLDGSLRHDCD